MNPYLDGIILSSLYYFNLEQNLCEVKELNTTLCDAIRDGEIVEFDYDNMVRIVEPFVYGLTSDGLEVLKGYQIGGYNRENDNSYDWVTFEVSQIGTIKFIGKKFTTKRDGLDEQSRDVKTLYCRF